MTATRRFGVELLGCGVTIEQDAATPADAVRFICAGTQYRLAEQPRGAMLGRWYARIEGDNGDSFDVAIRVMAPVEVSA